MCNESLMNMPQICIRSRHELRTNSKASMKSMSSSCDVYNLQHALRQTPHIRIYPHAIATCTQCSLHASLSQLQLPQSSPLPPTLLLPRQPNTLNLLLCNTQPLFLRDPPNIRTVAETTDPVHLLNHQPHPLARVNRIARQPCDSVRVILHITSRHGGVLLQVVRRQIFEAPHETEAREGGGGAPLVVLRVPPERQGDV
jgi:hypothetical protein